MCSRHNKLEEFTWKQVRIKGMATKPIQLRTGVNDLVGAAAAAAVADGALVQSQDPPRSLAHKQRRAMAAGQGAVVLSAVCCVVAGEKRKSASHFRAVRSVLRGALGILEGP